MAALLSESPQEIKLKSVSASCRQCQLRIYCGQMAQRQSLPDNKTPKSNRTGSVISPFWTQVVKADDVFHGAETESQSIKLATSSIEVLKARGFEADELHAIIAPRRTLARRLGEDRLLSASESDRVLRVERIAEMADRIFGNPVKSLRWLRKPNRALENARPIDLLQSETGAHLVEQALHRIDFGMFA